MICLTLGLTLVLHASVGDLTSLYYSSPLEVRKQLRSDYAAGVATRRSIERLAKMTGDHSFDDLSDQNRQLQRAFRLQRDGLDDWNRKKYEDAITKYRKAQTLCLSCGARIESLFCLYYLAEIRAEQSRYRAALVYLNQALRELNQDRYPFLSALLNESRGYALWFLDYLPDSIESFAEASRHWKRIGFSSGLVASWNNLACLFEQLQLLNKANHCYLQALRSNNPETLPEISFQLLRNYAVFQKRRGLNGEALMYLNQCKRFREVSPDEFQLAEAEILERRDLLHSVVSDLLSIRIEKEFLLSQFYLRNGDGRNSRRSLRKALSLSEDHGLHFYTRRAAWMLGRSFERQGEWERAAAIYAETLEREQALQSMGTLFPYRRTISPLFDGWLRCQIRLKRNDLARQAIQKYTRLRQLKASMLLRYLPHISDRTDKLEQFTEVILAEGPVPRTNPTHQGSRPNPKNYSVVQMWPCEDEVYVWVDTPDRTHFSVLNISEEAQNLIESIVSTYHSTRFSLPFQPTARSLQLVYSSLFRPIERLIPTRRVLIIPHKELQSIPFELATSNSQSGVSPDFVLSYLPCHDEILNRNHPVKGDPLLFMPETFSNRTGAKLEEAFFRNTFQQIRVIRRLAPGRPLIAHWIHSSTHFRLNRDIWPVSTFENSGQKLSVLDFLRGDIRCELFSFGACDTANSHGFDSPFWLGLAELLLVGGSQSLVMSRWQLDEASSQIFIDFYRFCRNGLSMDEALHLARLRFLKRHVKRLKTSYSGSHPYFWAGIIYVGQPGKRLYLPRPREESITLALMMAAFWTLFHSRERRRR